MKYIFKKLDSEATFESFRAAHLEAFDNDYYEFTNIDEIPVGKIKTANDPFIMVENNHVTMWIDDGDEAEVEI